jgi:hypothetical protein
MIMGQLLSGKRVGVHLEKMDMGLVGNTKTH